MRDRFEASGKSVALVAGTTAVALAVASCGGSSTSSSSSSTSSNTTASSTTASSSSSASPSNGATSSVTTGPVRGKLAGPNHAPRVNRSWKYSITVSDATGQPLSGTAEIQFVFGGEVVGRDTPPTHPITNGRWHDDLTFPAQATGIPLTFRAVVRTAKGSITLDWPVTVTR